MPSLLPVLGTLGSKRAAHLLRRATFGATRKEIEEFASKDIDDAISDLFSFPMIPDAPVDGDSGITWESNGGIKALKDKIHSWFIYHAIRPDAPPSAFYKLVFFLHTCVTVDAGVQGVVRSFWYFYLILLMQHTDKSYKTLIRKICVDNAMGDFLDINSNTKDAPNENFARELLELFTLGKGPQIGPENYTNYTESDIREAARILTGYKRNDKYNDESLKDPDTGIPILYPQDYKHDDGDKEFSSAFQNRVIQGRSSNATIPQEIDELVDMIFDQSEVVSLFICRKLYRYYVQTNITEEIENSIIKELARTFRQNNFSFLPVLRQLLKSKHFYDEDDATSGDHVYGGLIKNPMELWFGAMRYFHAYIPDMDMDTKGIQFWLWKFQERCGEIGMKIFQPPSVAGYVPMYQEPDFHRAWISAATLPKRYDYLDRELLHSKLNEPIHYGKFDILDFVENPNNVPSYSGNDAQGVPGPHEGARIAEHLVDKMLEYTIAGEVSEERRNYFLNDLLLDNLSPTNWMFEWDNYKATGDDDNVRPQLVKLYRGIIQSPEYQLL